MKGLWQPSRAILATAAMALLSASGCGKPAFLSARDGEFPLVDNSGRPEAVKDFMTLFNTHCRGCHGTNGRDGAAPPLNDPLFLVIVPEAELRRVITEGRKGTLMPAFARSNGGALTEEQVEIVVRNLHAPGDGNDWKKADVSKSVPAYLASKKGDTEQGSGVFEMNCAQCHGDKGEGTKKAGPLNDPAFLALCSDQMLRRIVITGRHDLGMPAFDRRDDKKFKPMTDQDVTDVVTFLAGWRKPLAR